MFKLKREMRKRWQRVRMKTSSMNGYLHESLAGMRVTEAFVREDENQDTFEMVNNEIRERWMRAVQINNSFWPALDVTGTLGTVLVYYFGVKFMGDAVHSAAAGEPAADSVVPGQVLGAAQHAVQLL